MQRKFLGLFIILTALVCIGCKNPVADTSATDTPVIATPATTSDKTITLLAIPGVVAPVRGAIPVTTAIDTAQYTGTITWSPADSPFAVTTLYTATIVLTAKAGWTLSGVAANGFTVAGATATNAVNSGKVTAVFPATGVAADIDVTFTSAEQEGGTSNTASTTSLTLSFSVAPTTLAASDITVTGATKGTLSGTGTTRSLAISAISVANGETVSVTITSPTGFAITGSPRTAVVYKAPSSITTLAITGVVAPATGATPVTTGIDTTQYTGTITWAPVNNPFAATTVYTATIVLTAKLGWTLAGVAQNSFTVAGATVTNAANSGSVAAVFPVTALDAPLNVRAMGNTSTSNKITWTANGAVSYNLYWANSPGVSKSSSKISGIMSIASPKTHDLLTDGYYYYVVTAVNAAGESPVSAEVSANPSYFYGGTGPGGGYIFYDSIWATGTTFTSNNDPCRYLEAANADQSSGIVWWRGMSGWIDPAINGGGATATVTKFGIGTGYANTQAIINDMEWLSGTGECAATVCTGYSNNGKADWFLPSNAELALVFANLQTAGLGNITSAAQYWTSTQFTASANTAYFNSGSSNGGAYAAITNYVRAIRAF